MSEQKLWWVPDSEEVWALATQISAVLPNGCVNFQVQKSGKTVTLATDHCMPTAGSNAVDPEDLVLLHEVNQATILNCTRSRFHNKKIYTSMGEVLMSVNPFEVIPGLYGKDEVVKYRNPLMKKNLPSHVYSVPCQAYADMKLNGRNQSILISGESGAGELEESAVWSLIVDLLVFHGFDHRDVLYVISRLQLPPCSSSYSSCSCTCTCSS